MNQVIKKLSVRQVASIASLSILALALPIGLSLTEKTQDLRRYAQEVPLDPTPTPDPSPTPTCEASSSAVLKSGTAPYTIRLEPFAANSGNDGGITGYQWDFEGDGTWDTDRFVDHGWVDHTYSEAGVYFPKYRVRGHTNFSEPCDHPFDITVSQSTTPSPTPNPIDIHADGEINIIDYTVFITGFINALNQ